MADSRLSVRDRELFLAEPHIAALSVSAGPGRGPLTVPIWYQYEPGGEAWVLTDLPASAAMAVGGSGAGLNFAGWFAVILLTGKGTSLAAAD